MNRPYSLLIFFMLSIPFWGCINKKDKKYDKNPDTLWFDYQVTGREGNDNLTILLQFRNGGKDGMAIAAGLVLLDGEPLPADSTRMTGVFYELHKPIASFTGNHTILFTDLNKKQYREEFNFQPLHLLKPIADTMHRSDLIFTLEGLDKKDNLRVLLTDTTFFNNGINRVDQLINGNLLITKADLESLADGPVQLELIKEQERKVENGRDEGGRLSISYSLKREFFLKY